MKNLLLTIAALIGIIPMLNAQNCSLDYSLQLGNNPGEFLIIDNSTMPNSTATLHYSINSVNNPSIGVSNASFTAGSTLTLSTTTDGYVHVDLNINDNGTNCDSHYDSIYVNTNNGVGCDADFTAVINYSAQNSVTVLASNPNLYTNEYNWDFGDGTVILDGGNMLSHSYVNPGTYTIECEVVNSNSTCTDVHTESFTVNAYCDASFNYVIDFTNGIDVTTTSLGFNSGNNQYNWDFGDGTVITNGSASETHTYSSIGNYDIELEVVSPSGLCSDVVVNSVNINYDCNAFVDITNSTSGGVLNFSNGSYTNDPNGSMSFEITGPNNYFQQVTLQNNTNFSLSVSSNGNYSYSVTINGLCQNTFTDSYLMSSFPPAPVCNAEFNPYIWVNLFGYSPHFTMNGPSFSHIWDFGDGTPVSTSSSGSHEYQPGEYTVEHSVTSSNSSGTCTDAYGMNIQVEPYQCVSGFDAQFYGDTLMVFPDYPGYNPQYSVDYGDGTGSNLYNSNSIMNNGHVYQQDGAYNVCVTVTDSLCTNTYCQQVVYNSSNASTIQCVADFTVVPDPNNASLIYVVDNSLGSNMDYLWNFGDASYLYDYQYPTHTYGNVGTYTIQLDVNYSYLPLSDSHTDVVTVTTKAAGTEVHVIPSLNVLGLEDEVLMPQVSIYPNPSSSGVFNLKLISGKTEDLKLTVRSTDGRICYFEDMKSFSTHEISEIDLTNFDAGVYLVSLTTADGVQKLYRIIKS